MALRQSLVDTLDEISSLRTPVSRRTKALENLERLLAEECTKGNPDNFLQLQDNFECNIASRVMPCIESAGLIPLDQAVTSAVSNGMFDAEIASIARMVAQALCLLQGVSLLHAPSKVFLAKRWCIQLFVDLLVISRRLSSTPLTPTTNTGSTVPNNAVSLLASGLIDTVLCVLVDAPSAIRTFEEMGGVEVVVKMLKQTGVPRDIRIKCLEFLYFYLLDETSEGPPTRSGGHVSRVSSLEDISPRKPTPKSLDTPSPSPESTPRTPRNNRNLGLLRKELDFVPITPKKTQVSRLGIGTPLKTNRGTPAAKPGTGGIPPLPTSPTKSSHKANVSPQPSLIWDENNIHKRHGKTTQEKKELLAGLLGNVDALVESVAKSGIWGLG